MSKKKERMRLIQAEEKSLLFKGLYAWSHFLYSTNERNKNIPYCNRGSKS